MDVKSPDDGFALQEMLQRIVDLRVLFPMVTLGIFFAVPEAESEDLIRLRVRHQNRLIHEACLLFQDRHAIFQKRHGRVRGGRRRGDGLSSQAWSRLGIALLPIADFSALSRRLPLPESWKVKAQSDMVSSASKPGFWRLLGRGALAMLGIVTVMMLLPGMMMVPIAHSMGRARKVHDSICVGMTVPEVVDASRDCDLFGAASESVSDDHAVGEAVPT